MSNHRLGKVYLVGAGPGDPGLLTIKGKECLEQADVVLYDYLANPALLRYAPDQAERIYVGRRGRGHYQEQADINRLLIERAKAGQVVVRLKGVLTPAERQLAKTAEGVDMVKRLRQNLIAQGRDKLCEQVSDITGAKTIALFTDIDVQIGERVFVFSLDRDIQSTSR